MLLDIIFPFIASSMLICLAPGPDNLFVLTQAASYGWRAGVMITLGLCTGLLFHTLAVALGLAAVVQTFPVLMNAIVFLGAAYLVYLAWLMVYQPSLDEIGDSHPATFAQLYLRGVVMNVTNPKVSIFFLAFLPQFIPNETADVSIYLIALGCVFLLIAFVLFTLVACLASYLGPWLLAKPNRQLTLNRMAAFVFIALATKLVFSLFV